MNQRTEVLLYLKLNGSITPLDALQEFGCFRLAARIEELRARGHEIETIMERHKNGSHAKYVLKEVV